MWGSRCQGSRELYFDLEQYIQATNTMVEEVKVTLATMHLADNAKLW